jgi:hypothetical protein
MTTDPREGGADSTIGTSQLEDGDRPKRRAAEYLEIVWPPDHVFPSSRHTPPVVSSARHGGSPPWRRRAAMAVYGHEPLGTPGQACRQEAGARIRRAWMPLDLRHHEPSAFTLSTSRMRRQCLMTAHAPSEISGGNPLGDELRQEEKALAIGVAAFVGKDRSADVVVNSSRADRIHVHLGQRRALLEQVRVTAGRAWQLPRRRGESEAGTSARTVQAGEEF